MKSESIQTQRTRLVPLGHSGEFAIVDNNDYELVSRFKWHESRRKRSLYAHCSVYVGILAGRQIISTMSLHQLIMRPSKGMEVDHINHNGLDCRRSNMRLVDRYGNVHNARSHLRATSPFKGVFWARHAKKWRACLYFMGQNLHLGYFKSEIDAAGAYDEAARKYFGQHAYLNFTKGHDINAA